MSHFLRKCRRAVHPLILEALTLMALLRLSFWCLPYSTVRRMLDSRRPAKTKTSILTSGTVQEIAAAVSAVARHLPGLTTCLIDALAVEVMLRRRGFEPILRFGIRGRGRDQTSLQAHAWVECGGSVVVGWIPELSEYTPFTRSA